MNKSAMRYTLERTAMFAPLIIALGVIKQAPWEGIAAILAAIALLCLLSWCAHALSARYGRKLGQKIGQPWGASGKPGSLLNDSAPLGISHDVGDRTPR